MKKDTTGKNINPVIVLRDPLEVVSVQFKRAGITNESIAFSADKNFISVLSGHGITLYITREYEHLLVSLNAGKGENIRQTFYPLPHPSGLCFDAKAKKLYVASTRNPNMVAEFIPVDVSGKSEKKWLPSRVKYYSGSHYFHDLALMNDELYANSVGKNGIIKVDFNRSTPEEICWWPRCIGDKNPDTTRNYIQLNSIGAGKDIPQSYFTASGNAIGKYRPGHLRYPVDKQGVLYSGKTREAIVHGLTRPHSAKIYKGRVWLNNSGYGEFGYIDKNKFIPVIKLPGWTRGLSFCKDIAFVGVSEILPGFKHYAPGIKKGINGCAVYAVSLQSGEIIGSIHWENGNQVFGIDLTDNNFQCEFLYDKVKDSGKKETDLFYNY